MSLPHLSTASIILLVWEAFPRLLHGLFELLDCAVSTAICINVTDKDTPQVLDRVEVGSLCRPIEYCHIFFSKPCRCRGASMNGSVVVLEAKRNRRKQFVLHDLLVVFEIHYMQNLGELALIKSWKNRL